MQAILQVIREHGGQMPHAQLVEVLARQDYTLLAQVPSLPHTPGVSARVQASGSGPAQLVYVLDEIVPPAPPAVPSFPTA